MRILHVVTLISPDGSYGGPVRVAMNLAKGARDRGHDVTVAGAASGWEGPLPDELDGVPVRLFPARTIPGIGFAGTTSPGLSRYLLRAARTFDVVHIHFARDLVGVPAAAIVRLRGTASVLETHGMIDRPSNALGSLLDLLLVRRLLRSAGRIAVLTDREAEDLVQVAGPRLRISRVRNGVPVARTPATPESSSEVLFLARLQARKRPRLFVEIAAKVLREVPDARFSLVGPDEGEAAATTALIAELGVSASVRWEGPSSPDATAERLRRAGVFVLPSIGEVFPMSVLESLAEGVPVVLGRSSGIADAIERAGAGSVVDDDAESYVRAIVDLLESPERRRVAGDRAHALATAEFSNATVSDEMLRLYDGLLRP